jgi:hypothetical protein
VIDVSFMLGKLAWLLFSVVPGNLPHHLGDIKEFKVDKHVVI